MKTNSNSIDYNESLYSKQKETASVDPTPTANAQNNGISTFGKKATNIKNKKLTSKKKSLKIEAKVATDLSKTGLLGKLGKMDRKLIFYTDLEDDNELMREFLLKDVKPLTSGDLLKPNPDFGFNNKLDFTDAISNNNSNLAEIAGKKERSLEELNRRFFNDDLGKKLNFG